MFIKLRDGRVINALDVSIVKPFNAQAELDDRKTGDELARLQEQQRQARERLQKGHEHEQNVAESTGWSEEARRTMLQRQEAEREGLTQKQRQQERDALREKYEREAAQRFFLDKNEKFHARVFLASDKGHYLRSGGFLIEETPEEFQETANSQLRKYGFKPEL